MHYQASNFLIKQTHDYQPSISVLAIALYEPLYSVQRFGVPSYQQRSASIDRGVSKRFPRRGDCVRQSFVKMSSSDKGGYITEDDEYEEEIMQDDFSEEERTGNFAGNAEYSEQEERTQSQQYTAHDSDEETEASYEERGSSHESEEGSWSNDSDQSMELVDIENSKSPLYFKSSINPASPGLAYSLSPRPSALKSNIRSHKSAQSLHESNVSFADSITIFSSTDSAKEIIVEENSISLLSLSSKTAKESAREEEPEKESLAKTFAKSGFQAGLMMMIAPLFMFVRRCLCKDDDTDDVPLPNTNTGLENQAMHESSRNAFAGVYIHGDPVS